MGVARICTALVNGLDVHIIYAEADVSGGLPVFHIVGYVSADVKEAVQRVVTAIKNSGIDLPVRKIIVNLSPADMRKRGPAYDLPIAVSVLSAMGIAESHLCADSLFIGQLSLSGELCPVQGILPVAMEAREKGIVRLIVPKGNEEEAKTVKEIEVHGFSCLSEVVRFMNSKGKIHSIQSNRQERQKGQGKEKDNKPGDVTDGVAEDETDPERMDFSDMNGQEVLKRACMISAAGRHNMIMIGPPGAGKTMAAERMGAILPPMTEKESFEVTKIYSVLGRIDPRRPLIRRRPFRAVHHSSTAASLTGGGYVPMPGEISMAHKGILFLDEMTEFKRDVLEMLRQPLEKKKMTISRRQWTYTFPADFLLVCAANPCPCGYYPDRNKCRCTPEEVRAYIGKISGPLLDRIDLCVRVQRVGEEELFGEEKKNTSTAEMKNTVCKAVEFRKNRQEAKCFCEQSSAKEMTGKNVSLTRRMEELQFDIQAVDCIRRAFGRLELSARSLRRTAEVARTVADLEQSDEVRRDHVLEALSYRMKRQ